MTNIKKNVFLILIITATVVLGILAIITALKLYQLGKKPVAPTAPESKPEAVTSGSGCRLTFTVAVGPTNTPTPTVTPGGPTPTWAPTPTLTGTPPPARACFDECQQDNECKSRLRCLAYQDGKRCLNPSCPEEIDCGCNQCWDTCSHDWECVSGLKCLSVDNQKRCVNKDCPSEQDCGCPEVSTPTPTSVLVGQRPTPTPKPTAEPTMVAEVPPQPVTGLKIPTLGGILGGLFLLSLGLALIF